MDEVSWIKTCKWSQHLTAAEREKVTVEVKRWLRGETADIATPSGITVEVHGDKVLAVAKRPPKRRRI